jgi:hypothetical protein
MKTPLLSSARMRKALDKPAPTGSDTPANTSRGLGRRLRVTPKIALGRRSTSSFANVLIVSASAALQRSSIRRLLPSVHPNFASAVRTPRAKTARLNRSPHRPHADQPHRAGGLRARRERPCDCRTAEKRDELALSHSITSSARARSVGGMSRFSERAVWRLMTNSNLVDCRTGRSAGLAPLSMLPV